MIECTLMHKDIKVLELMLDYDLGYIVHVNRIINEKHLPIAVNTYII